VNSYDGLPLADSSSVELSNYRLRLSLEYEYVSEYAAMYDLVSTSYAVACNRPFTPKGLKTKVKDFRLFTNKDIFQIPAGTYFPHDKIRLSPENHSHPFYNVEAFLEHLNRQDQFISHWLISFTDSSSASDFFQFTIELELEDGKIFSTQSETIRFN